MTVHHFTDAQVKAARHMLGLARSNVAYRNYYTGENADLDDLVSRGFATKRQSPIGPDPIYNLTKQAAFFFLNAGEKLDAELRFATVRRDE